MKVKFLKEFAAKTAAGETRTVAAGTILELSPDKAARLTAAGIAIEVESHYLIWKSFVISADTLFRKNTVTPEAWELHKNHRQAAQLCFENDCIPEARLELQKALTALQSVSDIQ